MKKQKTITICVFLGFFAILPLTLNTANAETLLKNDPFRAQIKLKGKTMQVIKRGRTFRLVKPKGEPGPIFVSFDGCVNSAKSTCGNGVSSVDHDEETGSCGFTCLAAPTKPKN